MWITLNWEELQAHQQTSLEFEIISVYKNQFQTNNTRFKDI